MRVLHISTLDSGGAGLCALRIHNALLKKGIDSRMLVAHKASDDPLVVQVEKTKLNMYIPPRNKYLRKYEKLKRKRGKCLTELERLRLSAKCIEDKATYTFPLSNYDLSNHPLVAEADIIHLHWIGDFLDYPTFFSHIKKPVIWTLHDENIGFGGFHYQRDKDKYYGVCGKLEDELFMIKRNALSQAGSKIHIVAISSMMKDFCQRTISVSSLPITLIHNGIESDLFVPIPQEVAKRALGIPSNNMVVAFCAQSLSDERKGLKELLSALKRLDDTNISLLCGGAGELPTKTNVHVVKLGMMQSEKLLSLFYSAADLFVMPSFQEAFAQTPMEAMACGTPVVSFPCSGAGDLITEENGVVCDDFTVSALVSGIKKAIKKDYNRERIREELVNRFSYNIISEEYLRLYNQVLS